jgi:hypothetical protein
MTRFESESRLLPACQRVNRFVVTLADWSSRRHVRTRGIVSFRWVQPDKRDMAACTAGICLGSQCCVRTNLYEFHRSVQVAHGFNNASLDTTTLAALEMPSCNPHHRANGSKLECCVFDGRGSAKRSSAASLTSNFQGYSLPHST